MYLIAHITKIFPQSSSDEFINHQSSSLNKRNPGNRIAAAAALDNVIYITGQVWTLSISVIIY